MDKERKRKMDHIIELIKKNERLFLEHAGDLTNAEADPEGINACSALQGAAEEEFSASERQF